MVLMRDSTSESCPTFHLPARLGPFQGPIVIENWKSESSSSEGAVREAVVLTTNEVAAISLEGRTPIPTHAESFLPDELRTAVVELRGGSDGNVLGVAAPPLCPDLTSLR